MRSKKRQDEDVPAVPLRRVLGLFRPHRWGMALLLTLVLVQAAISVSAPFFLRALLDVAMPARDVGLVSLLAGGMLASALGAGALSVLTNRLSNVIGQRMMHEVRVSVFGHLQRMSLAFFTRSRGGDAVSTVVNDIGGVNTVLTDTATGAVQAAVSALAVSAALLVLDWQLALVALIVVPGLLLLTPKLGRMRRRVVGSRQRRLSTMVSLLTESLSVSGVLLARTMGNEAELRRRFSAESAEVSRLEVASAMIGRWTVAARRYSLVAVPAVVYWIAGIEVANGVRPTTLGTIVAFTSMLNRLVSPIGAMQSLGQGFSAAMALFGRIFAVLDRPVDIADRDGARALAVTGGEVTLRGVSFAYDPPTDDEDAEPAWALRDVDLTVPAGTSTAIVGSTGSGKSTLGYLVARLYEPRRGTVCIDGADVRDVTMSSLADAVGLVTQETFLLHDTVAANLRFAKPDATDAELEAAARAAHIHDMIASLPDGYETVVGERGFRFSGGERQRIAIARVLLRNPPVLVLDEATSALDNRTERAVQAALDELSKGRTTIAIAHRLSTVADADQVVVLDHGRIVERGRPADLLAAGGRFAHLSRAATG